MGRFVAFFRRLLLPFSWLYGGITDVRNWLYDQGYQTSTRFEIPVISVGNLTVGGTGKTPHIEYLIRLLSGSYELATLSRGYGRKTKGFRLANADDTVETLGDEPLQVFRKFGTQVHVTVGEKRAEAIPKILENFPDTNLILLDDAYQHRPVNPSINILLTDFNRLFYHDFPFPAGNLRERRKGARRADAVIVTKCPTGLDAEKQNAIRKRIQQYTDSPIFFSCIQYGQPVDVLRQQPVSPVSVILVSGIAHTQSLEAYVQTQFDLKAHLNFPDHHAYTPADWQKIRQASQQHPGSMILTTEKDAVKLKPFVSSENNLSVLPIEVVFLSSKSVGFNDWLVSSLEANVKNA